MRAVLKILTSIVVGLLFVYPSAAGAVDRVINGFVETVTGDPILGAKIESGDVTATSDKAGRFSITMPRAPVYELAFSAPGHYPMRHTLGDEDLFGPLASNLPNIKLVAKKPGRALLFAGDAMMGRRFWKPRAGEPVLIKKKTVAEDTRRILSIIKPYIELADFASVNLETQIMREEPSVRTPKSVTFFSPPEMVDALKWAGFDYVTLGNNHTYDYMDVGVETTVNALKARGMAYSGGGVNEAAALAPYRVEIGGQDWSHLGYVGWKGSFIPHQAAEGEKGGPALGYTKNILSSIAPEIAAGRATAIQYHGGLEYLDQQTLVTESRLKAAIDHGADIALAHHPHVFQGFEVYKDRLIAYSLGNFVFDQEFYATQASALVYVWMDGEQFYRAEIVPIQVKGFHPTPATGAARRHMLKRISSLSSPRGVALSVSGGHGVIDPSAPTRIASYVSTGTDGFIGLPHLAWHGDLVWPANGVRYRFGRDLLWRGSFEDHHSFGVEARNWLQGSAISIEAGTGYKDSVGVRLGVNGPDKPTRFGMRNFARVFTPGTPATVRFKIRTTVPERVEIYLQRYRRNRRVRDELDDLPLLPIGAFSIEPDAWQELAVNFNTPRVGTIGIRLLIDVYAEGEGATILDDLTVTEWLTPMLDGSSQPSPEALRQATHLEISN